MPFQPLLPAAQQLSGGGGVNGVGESSQAQTTSAIGSAAPAAVTGTVSTSQAQTVALAGNSAIPAAVSGTASTSQAQSVDLAGNSAIPAAVSGTASTSQAQSVEGTASGGITPVDEGIQPIHGYNFDNDRRLLKARREKEKRDKQSFAEQLEAIKPQVVSKTDTEAAIEFVERISALKPYEQPESKPIDLGFLADSRLRLSESEAEDEAIALIIAALL